MWVIVKMMVNLNGIKVPVIILDSHGEVMEFETIEQAEEMRCLFEKNSDSGHEYIVKKI